MSDDTLPFRPRDASLSDSPTGPIRSPVTLGVEVGGRTDKGRVRPGNEDAFGLEPPNTAQARAHGTLLVVADGMGGHAAGEVASNLAVDTVLTTYYRERAASTAEAIRGAISTANGVIFDDAEQHAQRAGMGCTIVVMVVQGNNLTVGHVGDSRGYLIRDGRARQLTRDHSWVAMQVEEGVLTPEQAEHHPNRSLLMRALGRQPSIEVEIGQHQLQAGDVLLLCSDGLTGVVNDAEIGEYASRYAPATAADQLVSLANQRGAPDNVTVVAAAITGPAGPVAGADTTMTMTAPVADALTPRLVQPLDQPPVDSTTPTLRTPAVMGMPPAAMSAPPAGTPIVLSRGSAPAHPGVPARGRRGRGRWLAGSLAAFGLAAGLVLLTTLGPRTFGNGDPPRTAEAPASKPFSTPAAVGQAAPQATVPPPVATGIPGLAPSNPAAVPPPPAAPQPPAATPTTAVSAAASKPGTTLPGIAGIAATPTRPAGSPPALTAPTSVPTSTSTPTTSGADSAPPPGGADGSADSAAGAGASTGAAGPSDATEPGPNPDAGDPGMAEDPGAGGEATAEEPEPAPAPGGQPAAQPRVIPGTGITIPDGLPSRSRKPGDD